MTQDSPIVILGGNSQSGISLLRCVSQSGKTGQAISRRALAVPEGFTALKLDLNDPGDWRAPQGSIILSLLPIWILSPILPRLTEAKAVIATSSTSRFSKTNSGDAHERELADKLATAESALQGWAESLGVAWTILRPTLVYDGVSDRNVTRMARFIKRWRFLPIARPSNGLRQPIHADDVAQAVFKAIDNPKAANRAFNISGKEILTYRAMAERIFAALEIKPRFLFVPMPWVKNAFKIASCLGVVKGNGVGAAMFQRMNENLVFETESGLAALDYRPRPFQPNFSNFQRLEEKDQATT
ncbi:MAG: NAD-dependent epimerase/dehydratase family protein [Bdellovibrionales bacterium]